jgi:hypothetical protein
VALVALLAGLVITPLRAAAADGVGPVVNYTAPANNAILTSAPVTFSGTAQDNDGVISAEVAVQNRDTTLWLQTNGTWGTDLKRLPATMTPSSGATSVSWSWTASLVSGRYHVIGYATDGGNTRTKGADRYFELRIAPTLSVTTPAAGQIFSSSPVAFGGSAGDDLGVTAVSYAVQDTTSNLWWQSDGTWASTRTTFAATLGSPGATSTTWTAAWPGPLGSFRVEATATDTSGLTSPAPGVAFSVGDPAPTVTLGTPVAGQSFSTSPIVFAGTATDNAGVNAAQVAVQNRLSGQWFQPDGTWGSTRATFAASLSSPGSASTSWSYSWTPPGSGQYRAEINALDTTAQSSAVVGANFTYAAAPPDGVGPVITYVAPTNNAILTASPTTFSGTAQDNDGVISAEVAVQNRDTTLWLQANGTWGADLKRLPATMTPPGGATSVTWSWTYPLATGRYHVIGYATDGGNTRTKGADRYFELRIAPTVAISAPAAGQNLTASPVALAGSAADDLGVTAVNYAIQDTATNQWWQANNTWGSTRVTFAATLANPGSTVTTWTASWPAPIGTFRLEATATDTSGYLSTVAAVPFSRVDPPPTVVLGTPTQGQSFATSPVGFSGSAADDLGVTGVDVAIQNRVTGEWFQSDGTWGAARVGFAATLASPGATATAWTYSWNASGNGQFRAEATARDTAWQSSPVAGADFGLSDAPPVIAWTMPGDGATLTSSPVALTGTATDDVGITAVELAFQNTSTGSWYQADGTWAATRVEFDAALGTPGTTATSWSYSWPVVTYGTYRVEARAVDTVASTSGVVARQFTYFNAAPTATIGAPTDGQVLPLASIPVTGSATDDVGVSSVKVAVQNRTTGLWSQGDGTWAATRVEFDALLGSPGAGSTTWSWTFGPPAYDDYRVEARAVDGIAQSSGTAGVSFTYLDAAPTASIGTPTPGQIVGVKPVTVTGSAGDDVGVTAVKVAFQDQSTLLWLQTDGTWGATRVERDATVTTPGATSTAWTTSFTPPANGTYRVEARALDTRAQTSATTGSNFTYVDAAPVITVSSPTASQMFSAPPIGLAGSAADDNGVTGVKLAVKNTTSGLWLQADDTWAATRVERDAALSAPGTPNTAWTFTFDPGAKGSFSLEVRALDNAGQASALTTVAFSYDDQSPTATISTPVDGQQLSSATFGLGGTASDDNGVTGVKYAIQNTASGQWWNGTGFGATRMEFDASLAVPGGAFTTWSGSWTAPAFGQFRLEVRALDGTGHTSTTAGVNFGYTDQPPAASIVAPYANQIFQGTSVTFKGSATDDQGVSSVGVAIRDTASGQWLQSDGTWAPTRVTAAASLGTPNATSTTWTLTRTIGRTGNLVAEVTAVDAGAKLSSIASVGLQVVSQFNDSRTPTWSTNGKVFNVVSDGANRIYVGGQFDQVGPSQGGAVAVDATTGNALANVPRAAGNVYTSVADNNGGWYVGGDFNNVDNKFRRGVAHIKGDGTLDAPFTPRPNGTVYAIAVDYARNRVYIGGTFAAVQQEPHTRIAALDLTTGTPISSWTASASAEVRSLVLSPDGNTLYVGGKFTTLNGTTRNRIGALNPSTGALLSFNPGTNGDVYAIAPDATGSTLYVGGSFTNLAGTTRNRIGAVTSSGTLVTTFNPSANAPVWSLALSGSTVYAGGSFATIGGQSRPNVAALGTNGQATAFNPAPNGEVRSVRPTATGGILIAGNYTAIGGVARNRAALVDGNGLTLPWNPNASDFTYTAVPSSTGASVMVGGAFVFVGGVTRQNVAAFDLAAGGTNVTSWAANTDDTVYALAMAPGGSSVYLGGEFTSVNGVPRTRLAKVDTATGATDTTFVANADSQVRHLELRAGFVYFGGTVTNVNGKFTGRLGRANATTGTPDQNWTPVPDQKVNGFAFSPDGSVVYLAGQFTTVGGVARRGVAAVNMANASVNTTWAPSTFNNDSVSTLNVYDISVTPDGSRIYVASGGHQPGGNRVWAYTTTGTALWNVVGNGDAQGVTAYGGNVYISSHWDLVNNTIDRGRLLATNGETGAVLAWDPQANAQLGSWHNTMTPYGLVAVGEFTNIKEEVAGRVALFSYLPS